MNIVEEKIGAYTSKEALKAGKSLYDSGAVVYLFSDKHENNILSVKDSLGNLHKIVIKSFDLYIKNIKNSENMLSAIEVAALYHYFNYYNKLCKNTDEELLNLDKKKSNRTLAVEKELIKAKLILRSNNNLPNSSSTWESCSLSVEIIYNNRSYIGNPNKLRQLRFDENKTGTIKLSDFSSQDRQIIRFLSQYTEPDGSGFSLRSDLMAEFLHSLYGFSEFYFGNNQVIIHKSQADVVGIYSKEANSCVIKPALEVKSQLIYLKNHHLVVGKSGIWVGLLGEYWWVPAVYDVLWLRKFLLSEQINILPTTNLDNYPVRIIKMNSIPGLQYKKVSANYYFDLTDQNEFKLTIKYCYDNLEFDIGNNRLGANGKSFWRRDKDFENKTENELLGLGFNLSSEKIFIQNDIEGIGLFIDKIFPEWLNKKRKIFIMPSAISICSRVQPIKINCLNCEDTDSMYRFNYELTTGNGKVGWREAIKKFKNNRQYILLDNGTIGFVSEELSDFINSFKTIVKVTKNPDRIQLPKSSIFFWMKNGTKFLGEYPKEWLSFTKTEIDISKNQNNFSINNSFKGELREYQKYAVDWMKKMTGNGFNVILADEMGLGKTVQTLAFALFYKQKISKNQPCIVVCPTSLVENWKEECKKFTPGLKYIVVAGSNREDSIRILKDFDLVITSYALIKRDIEKYSKIKFGLLILDEAQHIKNPVTVNAKVCKSIISKHRLVLTGTPLENSPEDIWSIFDFLNPGMLGTMENFKTQYSKIEFNFEKQKELADRIAPFILRRHKNDVEQLPEKVEQTLFCEMAPAQKALYNNLLKDGKNRYQSFFDGKTTRFDILSSLLRMRQLCCHPKLLPDTLRQGNNESAKTELLKELLLETIDSGHRTLVFSQFTSLLAILKDWLDENSIVYEYLDGATKNRFDKVERFNKDKKISVFLLSLKAGGTGLNLTGADTVIIYDPWWNPSVEAQATDRTHRIGQKNKITSIKLVVRDSIEEKILELQAKKQGLFNGIVENSSSFKKLTDKDIAYLLN